MLQEHGLDYEEIVLNQKISSRASRAVTGATTVPQVFIDGESIGDSEALSAYLGA
ncbi:Peroxiredoxin family protein/glutaredoxin [uncultured Synechococcales cyanobacterium]|uniref:Peroxiredoxin family protein/glutaredoxin n=1 Tax=uncultured Synechococcales cyanobacterium TaxID=1936017 RepID=A0A6J4V6K7_9CYAN|nr:Peroxiredoxin family protein/glutaredoxin [uncultured Synechococcales cyanobacterium]